MDIGADGDVAFDRHAGEGTHNLEGAADPGAAELVRLAAHHVAAIDENLPRIRPQKTVEKVEKRCLARSVRSDDAENRAFADREADILHSAQAAERFRDPARLQD